MTDYEAVEIAEGFGNGEDASDEDRVAAWQHLIDTGLCWHLQGWFGRTAARLIEDGTCHAASDPAKVRAHRRASHGLNICS